VARRFAVIWLCASGLVLMAAGLAAVVIGTWQSAWLYAQLPALLIDARAVGGAATASGAAMLGLGCLSLAAGWLLRRGTSAAATPIVILAALMALLAIGWGVAALVSAASGSGPGLALVPAGIGLLAIAFGYGWAARAAMALREEAGARS
jgi:hypothetical protein